MVTRLLCCQPARQVPSIHFVLMCYGSHCWFSEDEFLWKAARKEDMGKILFSLCMAFGEVSHAWCDVIVYFGIGERSKRQSELDKTTSMSEVLTASSCFSLSVLLLSLTSRRGHFILSVSLTPSYITALLCNPHSLPAWVLHPIYSPFKVFRKAGQELGGDQLQCASYKNNPDIAHFNCLLPMITISCARRRLFSSLLQPWVPSRCCSGSLSNGPSLRLSRR